MPLAIRARALPRVSRPVVTRQTHIQTRPVRFARLITFSTSPEIEKKLQEALKEADAVCADGKAQDCAVAYDTVEELAAAAAHKKVQEKEEYVDPLDEFCKSAPDADECRVYED